jgi:hypothetical protein
MVKNSIYLIRAGKTDFVKIGFSNNIPLRIKSLQTGNHEQLHSIYEKEFDVNVDEIKDIERDLHIRYLHTQSGALNEWFVLNDKDVEKIIYLLEHQEELKLTEEEIYQTIFRLKNRQNLHFLDQNVQKNYQKRDKRKQCLSTFGEEFLADSYKKPLNLAVFPKDLPPAPSDFDGKIVGKTVLWSKDFGFIQYVAKEFAWKHYCLRYKISNNLLQKIVPENLTIEKWIEELLKTEQNGI